MIRTKIKKINPERSNKMAYAVAAGLAVILIVFFTLAITSSGKGGGRSMAKTLSYLKNTEGLIEIQAMEPLQRAVIVYNSDSKNAGNFEKVAHYAALRLAPHWPDCEVQLAKNKAKQIVYVVRVKSGAITSESPVPVKTDWP